MASRSCGTRYALYQVDAGTGGTRAQIAIISADGSRRVTVLTTTESNSQGPVWAPDDKRIAYKNNLPQAGGKAKDELWVLTADKPSDAHVIVAPEDAGSVAGSPVWGPR